MLNVYFTIRHLLRQKTNSLLHLTGLTSGNYRLLTDWIEIGWDLFALTALSLVGLMTLTVGFRVVQAASENPVNALKE